VKFIGAKAKLRHKLSKIIEKEIRAFARVKGLNPESGEYEELAQRLADRLAPDIAKPCLLDICLVADDDGEGGYKNPRIVERTGSAEEVLYPESPITGEPVDERIADYMLPLPDPQFLPEI
jgi:hypothetical protein